MPRRKEDSRQLDELTTFVTAIYDLININRVTTIRNTIKNVKSDRFALKMFVQNVLTCNTMLELPMTDIELGTILFRLLLNREITQLELGNMIEYLEDHTRSDMVFKILASHEWAERVNLLV